MAQRYIIEEDDVIVPANNKQIEKIKDALGEDPGRMDNHLKLFKEWLRYSAYLPSDVDQRLIKNFIRLCKHDLEKAKNKFEAYVALRPKIRLFFTNRILSADDFDPALSHRNMMILPKLTEDGYRVVIYRLESPDIKIVNYEKLFKYASILLDFILYKDVNAGFVNIYDFTHFNMQQLGKFNLTIFRCFIEILYKIGPFRLKQVHVISSSSAAEVLLNISMTLISKKLKERFIFHKSKDTLTNYIDPDVLVKEYNGTGESLITVGNRLRDYFLTHGEWLKETEELKLTGPVPKEKESLYSFEDYAMDGSFRKLNID